MWGSKFSRKALVTVGEIADIDCFVTDLAPSARFSEKLEAHDVRLITANEPADN